MRARRWRSAPNVCRHPQANGALPGLREAAQGEGALALGEFCFVAKQKGG